MALELYKTSKKNRLYREVLPDGSRRGYMRASIGPMHYESTVDSGEFDTPISMDMERVTNNQLDGYRITNNGWHYAVQTVDPATSAQQPNNQRPAGTVGFGGRQGQHWFMFRLRNVGYLHWPTRDVTDLGGQPDYSATPTVTSQIRNLGRHPLVPDEIQTYCSQLVWPGIWTTPGGGDLTVQWSLKAGKMKEDIIINQAAREWIFGKPEDGIPGNRPPTTPANETWFGFRFQIDVSDIPRAYRNGIRQRWNQDDFDDDEGNGIALTDAADRLLAFMPLDEVYATNRGGSRPLRKRFYRQGNQNFLFVGCRVDQLAQLLSGDLVFDPSMTQENIVNNADDADSGGTAFHVSGYYANQNYPGYANGGYISGVRFTPNLPQGASLTGGGSEYAALRLYRGDSFAWSGTPNAIVYGDDQDNAPAWGASDRPNQITNTTASTTVTNMSDPGSGNQIPDANGIDIAAIVEEICARAGWSANNGMRFNVAGEANAEYFAFFDSSDATGQEALLDAFYTTAGGGATEIDGTTDTFSISEQAASVNAANNIAGALDTLTLAAQAAAVNAANNVDGTVDALSLAEQAASINAANNLSAALDALTLAEQAGAVSLGVNIQGNTDAFTVSELAAQIARTWNAAVDALTLGEQAAVVGSARDFSGTVDALTLAEQSAAINAANNIDGAVDALTLTEPQASVQTGAGISGTSVSLSIAEQAATVLTAFTLDAGVDLLTVGEQAATVSLATSLDGTLATYTVGELQATVLAAFAIGANVDAFTIAAQAANVIAGSFDNIAREVALTGAVDAGIAVSGTVDAGISVTGKVDAGISLSGKLDPV